jgi:hypothetical protein
LGHGAVDPPGPGPSGDRPGELPGELEAMEHLQMISWMNIYDYGLIMKNMD